MSYSYVQVNEFQANSSVGWNTIENVSWSQKDSSTILLTNAQGKVIQLSFLSPTTFRVRFNPVNSDYSLNRSYAVVNYDLGTVNLQLNEQNTNGGTLYIETGVLQVRVGLAPYGIAVYKNGQLIHEDAFGKNLIYSNEAVANLKSAPDNENYYGFGEKAGAQLNKKKYTMTFFNYDNFTYNDVGGDGFKMVPENNAGGPLNPSGPLYNSMPFCLAVGSPQNNQPLYSYGLFFDNVAQSYFNMGSNDYSDMDGKYYFGALYGDLDYYVMVGNEHSGTANVIADVLAQYAKLTGASAMPPKYAFGYQQGGYGYYNRQYIEAVAQRYRDAQIPIDGLHIDVDFQDNYRTFTVSPEKFPDPKGMFDGLHANGFKCSTNITGIITANPLDEKGDTDTPYPTRDDILNLDEHTPQDSTYKDNAPVRPFIYNTRAGSGESPDLFIAQENYGDALKLNTSHYYPSPGRPADSNTLGTYGYYSDMGHPDVKEWWGQQYKYLLELGLDMIWQDMTCPAVGENFDNKYPYKTLPLDMMMYDSRTDDYEPNAKIHNTFAINLVQATYEGITKLKSSDDFKNLYNYKKRNFIIARGGYAGIHRYAGIWTGDSASSWDFLSINIPEILNIGLSGLPISGSDIGGFANGPASEGEAQVTNYRLYTRWMTSGAFLPWYRNHYDRYTKDFQEPYMYAEPVPTNCRKYIEIRYKLIQVFYDAMYENTQNGMPIARAMFLNDPHDPAVYGHSEDQFFLGKDILVAPAVTDGVNGAEAVYRDIYLPSGSEWYVFTDLTTAVSAPTPGGTTQNWYVPLDLVPVYVREGAIIPLRQLEQYIGQLDTNPITFQIYPGEQGNYTLYQDDETTTANVEAGAYRVTQVSHSSTGGSKTVRFQRSYDKFTPKETFFYVALMAGNANAQVNVMKGTSSTKLNNVGSEAALEAASTEAFYFNDSLQTLFVKVFDTDSDISVTIQ